MLELENVPRGTLENYIQLLEKWNNKINLIRYKDREELWQRHIIDSTQLINYIEKDKIIMDIGSGAGFPGLILSYLGVKKIYLVESNNKKANFLQIAAKLSQKEIIIYNKRLEELNIKNIDYITARGFSEIINILEKTENLRNLNTKYILLKGQKVELEIKKALEKYQFNYILHQSHTNQSGKIIEISQVSNA